MHVCINSKCVTDIRLVVLPADCLGYILLCFASPGISRQVRLKYHCAAIHHWQCSYKNKYVYNTNWKGHCNNV